MMNSRPNHQFAAQVNEETERLLTASGMCLLQQPDVYDWEAVAQANVQYRWSQQCIWDEKRDLGVGEAWKHESQNPPSSDRSSKTVIDAGLSNLRNGRRRGHEDLREEYHEAVRSAVECQIRQLSRPCHQFVFQFCEERRWIKMGLSKQNQAQNQNADLDRRAYETVKARWIRFSIWDDDWTNIPGIWWKHEQPSKIPFPDEMFRTADAYKAARIEQYESPPAWYFIAPVKPPLTVPRRFSPSISPEAPSDASDSLKLEIASKTAPARSSISRTIQKSKQTNNPRNMRQSVAAAKTDTEGHKHKHPADSPAQKTTKRLKTTPISIGSQRGKPATSSTATSERPRRIAFLTAMDKLRKAT